MPGSPQPVPPGHSWRRAQCAGAPPAPSPRHVSFPPFPSPAGFKIGLCSTPPLYSDAAALCLANSCAIRAPLATGYSRFLRLYRARAHIHHYLEYIAADEFQHAAEAVSGLIEQYGFDG